MDRLDEFAKAALIGLLADPDRVVSSDPVEIAETAYDYALEMMRVRNRRIKKGEFDAV